MNIKDVIFPEALLNALRDGRLVVFAGAGVSMGPPAGLPSFRELAEQVAEGTGKSMTEPEDRFLGQLKDDGVEVHQRAAGILQPENLEPNALHRNLLRLFQKTGDPVRIVTTNFDCLFEQAAETGGLFENKPKVFEAPALPLGSRFEGIVHLHGSVKEPEEMVLTHRDFGRAYLTEEDGWARRFLVSLFAEYTVLFVGYSHSDTIMTYLTPSLPTADGERRFALVGSKSNDASNDPNRWRRLGIEPVPFPQDNKSDFTRLDTGVKGLADFRQRGVLGWQQEIARIAEAKPPMTDNEDSHTIDHALKSVELTKFFVQAAESPEWIAWLDGRGHLKRLFAEGDLEEQDRILSQWLAYQFVRNHSDELFSVISKHGGRLNQHFWNNVLWKLAVSEENQLQSQTLSRWVHILINHIPINVNKYFLLKLMKHCARAGEFQSLLQVYDAITVRLVWFLPDSEQSRNNSWNHTMRELWERCLKPNFQHIAHTLLERTTMRLEERHSARVAWIPRDNNMMDDDSFSRSAIEPHEQDKYPHRIDPLIDVARDCLEWLAIHEPVTAGAWYNRFINSDSPLLRRLAIHAINTRQDLCPDTKMAWLLAQCNVNEEATHHEIFRMTAQVYPQASDQQRKELIQAVKKYQALEEKSSFNDELSTYHHFNCFDWLHKADPNCSLIKAELENALAKYPKFTPREHSDFTSYCSGFKRVKSPWTAEELLAKPAPEWLPDLLLYQPESCRFFEDRIEMLQTVCEAARSNTAWGLALADAMAEQSKWGSDLWAWVIIAWQKADLDQDSTRRVLSHLSTSELHYNAQDIAGVLNRLIQNTDAADLQQWLDTLHTIAINIHPYAVAVEDESTEGPQDRDWLREAINHPSGKLAEFWIYSIARWYNQQAEPRQALSDEYRCALDTIIQDQGIPGKLGRTILAGRFHFLHRVDSAWAEQGLLPLFDAEHEDFPCVWHGYLMWGTLSLQIAELLRDKLIGALQRVIQEFPQPRRRFFINCYIVALSWLIEDDQDTWIGEFFEHANENHEAKYEFTMAIDNHLRNLNKSEQQEWWNVWLKDYWNNRLDGIPCPLENAEIAIMIEEWVIHLQGVFSEAVSMALRMNPVTLEKWSRLLHQIDQSNLIDCHPNDLARFLIYLGQSDHLPLSWKDDLNVLHKLLEKDLPEELDQGLRELIARIEIT